LFFIISASNLKCNIFIGISKSVLSNSMMRSVETNYY